MVDKAAPAGRSGVHTLRLPPPLGGEGDRPGCRVRALTVSPPQALNTPMPARGSTTTCSREMTRPSFLSLRQSSVWCCAGRAVCRAQIRHNRTVLLFL